MAKRHNKKKKHHKKDHDEAGYQTDTEISEELKNIYTENGEMPDLTTLVPPKRSWRKISLVVTGALAAVVVLAWGAYLIFGNLSVRGNQDPLLLSITTRSSEAPKNTNDSLVSGAESIITIHYENTTNVPIASLSLQINLPDTFLLQNSIPEANAPGQTWELGNLSPGSDGKIELIGTAIGSVPSTNKIQTIASYRPANFSSSFDTIEVADLIITDSIAKLEFVATDKAVPGEEILLDLSIVNPTNTAVENVELALLLPDGFILSRTEPELEEDSSVWSLARLESHSKADFEAYGTFSSNSKGLYDIGGEIRFNHDDKSFVQTQKTTPIDIFGGALTTNVIVNGSSRDQNVNPGKVLRVSIPFENGSDVDMKDVEIKLAIESNGTAPIDWQSPTTDLAEGRRSGQTIRWDSDNVEELETIEAGGEYTLDLTLPLNDEINLDSYTDLFSLVVTTTASPTTNVTQRQSLSTSPLEVQVNSDFSISDAAHYFDEQGNEVGSGPLPPAVGETTKYAIAWSISNTLHDLRDVKLETTLPPHVLFAGNTDSSHGTVSYNAETRTVSWSINSLSEERANAVFHVSIAPSDDDIGTFVKLTNPVQASAADQVTNANLRLEGETLTSNLKDDDFVTTNGIVNE